MDKHTLRKLYGEYRNAYRRSLRRHDMSYYPEWIVETYGQWLLDNLAEMYSTRIWIWELDIERRHRNYPKTAYEYSPIAVWYAFGDAKLYCNCDSFFAYSCPIHDRPNLF